ncbi:MAG: type II toxin-antitoxin system RelE/ParE family toxin [Phycisphaerae bacterium]|nr:type II toxin-antitoxin system RelE/ParE family toxin [Phycisphaerae bacterium]
MRVEHLDPKLERLETDQSYRAGLDHKIIKAFRKTMAIIRAAVDERAFYALKGLHYEKLQGKRHRQRSMRLNDQFRLILELRGNNGIAVIVVAIENYH